jgi:hypothetical protein
MAAMIHDMEHILSIYPIIMTDNQVLLDALPAHFTFTPETTTYNNILSMVQTHKIPIVHADKLDDACNEAVVQLNPLKYVLLDDNGGVLDAQGNIISEIDCNQGFGLDSGSNLRDLIARMQDTTISGASYETLHKALRHIAANEQDDRLMAVQKKFRSMQVTSPGQLYAELLTTKGSGTLIRRGYDIETHKDGETIHFRESDGLGTATVTAGTLPRLNTLKVQPGYWLQSLPERLLQKTAEAFPRFYWTAHRQEGLAQWSPRLQWYLERQNRFVMQVAHQDLSGGMLETYIVGANPLAKDTGEMVQNVIYEAMEQSGKNMLGIEQSS